MLNYLFAGKDLVLSILPPISSTRPEVAGMLSLCKRASSCATAYLKIVIRLDRKDHKMTKKQIVEKQSLLKLKTGVKAGEHCWDAWNDLQQNPHQPSKIYTFVSCCRGDNKCLK